MRGIHRREVCPLTEIPCCIVSKWHESFVLSVQEKGSRWMLIYKSGWLDWLAAVEARGDGYYCRFGDAGFADDKYLQVMTKIYGGYIGQVLQC